MVMARIAYAKNKVGPEWLGILSPADFPLALV